jgi:hypothetical protein
MDLEQASQRLQRTLGIAHDKSWQSRVCRLFNQRGSRGEGVAGNGSLSAW